MSCSKRNQAVLYNHRELTAWLCATAWPLKADFALESSTLQADRIIRTPEIKYYFLFLTIRVKTNILLKGLQIP